MQQSHEGESSCHGYEVQLSLPVVATFFTVNKSFLCIDHLVMGHSVSSQDDASDQPRIAEVDVCCNKMQCCRFTS